MKVSSFNTHQRLRHGIISPAEEEEEKVQRYNFFKRNATMKILRKLRFDLKKHTLHVEVAMEIWRSISIKQHDSAIGHLLISVHHSVMLIITVCILEKKKNKE